LEFIQRVEYSVICLELNKQEAYRHFVLPPEIGNVKQESKEKSEEQESAKEEERDEDKCRNGK
jgi:hypothetical protein